MSTHIRNPEIRENYSGRMTSAVDRVVTPEYFENATCIKCLEAYRASTTPLPGSNTNSHYDAGGIVAIDVIRAKLTTEQLKGFYLRNSIKYALRMNHKGQDAKDAAKLAEYSRWLNELECAQEQATQARWDEHITRLNKALDQETANATEEN